LKSRRERNAAVAEDVCKDQSEKTIKVICGTGNFHPRRHRKFANCWIKPGNLFML